MNTKVTSLALSKRLKELGVKQESMFYWNILNGKPELEGGRAIYETDGKRFGKEVISYSAFLAEELGELLPDMIDKDNDLYWFIIERYNKKFKKWVLSYKGLWGKRLKVVVSESLSEGMALMVIYLKEQNLI